jgi:DNA gyrase subunit A
MEVIDGNEIMLISNKGTLVRTRVNEVSTVGRNTQGVRLIRTADDEKVVGLQRIDEIDEDEVLIDGEVVAEEGETAAEDNTENQEGSDES